VQSPLAVFSFELDVLFFCESFGGDQIEHSLVAKFQVSSSLRPIASRLGTDDTTVRYRYKRLEESGFLSGWQLLVNPTFYGCRMMDVTVDAQPESGKQDMIRKLKLIHEVAAIYDFYGRAMKIAVMYSVCCLVLLSNCTLLAMIERSENGLLSHFSDNNCLKWSCCLLV
jgi:DNA-binding Lrp family transcriptional regulator